MNSDINLISTDNKETLQTEKALLITRIVAVIFLVFVLISAIVIFILNLTSPMSSIRNQQNSALQNLRAFNNKSANYALLNDRLQNIFTVTAKRENYTPDFDKIFSLATDGITANSLTLLNGKVSFRVSSNSLLTMAQFIDGIFNMQDKKTAVKNINIDNLTLNVSNGTYSLSISAELL